MNDKVKRFLEILKTSAPMIITAIPGGALYAPLVINGIAIAEMSSKPGADKKVIAKAATRLGAETNNVLTKGNTHIDPDKAEAIADEVIDVIVNYTNQSLELAEPVVEKKLPGYPKSNALEPESVFDPNKLGK